MALKYSSRIPALQMIIPSQKKWLKLCISATTPFCKAYSNKVGHYKYYCNQQSTINRRLKVIPKQNAQHLRCPEIKV